MNRCLLTLQCWLLLSFFTLIPQWIIGHWWPWRHLCQRSPLTALERGDCPFGFRRLTSDHATRIWSLTDHSGLANHKSPGHANTNVGQSVMTVRINGLGARCSASQSLHDRRCMFVASKSITKAARPNLAVVDYRPRRGLVPEVGNPVTITSI